MSKVFNDISELLYYAIIASLLISNATFAEELDLGTSVLACSQISENQSRLSCFDALAQKNNVVVEVVSKSTVIEQPVLSREQIVDTFGKVHVKKTNEELAKEINAITLTITALSKNAYGKWNISFENGQKWQQKNNAFLNLKIGQRVILTKGAFSAIYLQKENTSKRIKVKRLK